MRPRRAPLHVLERAYPTQMQRPRLLPRLLVALIWIVSALVTFGFAWLMSSNLALALAVAPLTLGCEICEAGGFRRWFQRVRRPTHVGQLDKLVDMCPRHYAQADEAVAVLEGRAAPRQVH